MYRSQSHCVTSLELDISLVCEAKWEIPATRPTCQSILLPFDLGPGGMQKAGTALHETPSKRRGIQLTFSTPTAALSVAKLFQNWQFWGGGGWWWCFASQERQVPGLNPSRPGCRRTRFNKQKFSALLECAIFVFKSSLFTWQRMPGAFYWSECQVIQGSFF